MYSDFLKTQPNMSDQMVRFGQKVWDAASEVNKNFDDCWTRIVVNNKYGGFGLSEAALVLYKELKGVDEVHFGNIRRSDPILLGVLDTLGLEASSGRFANLAIKLLPKGTKYLINEYDGYETILTEADLTETA